MMSPDFKVLFAGLHTSVKHNYGYVLFNITFTCYILHNIQIIHFKTFYYNKTSLNQKKYYSYKTRVRHFYML